MIKSKVFVLDFGGITPANWKEEIIGISKRYGVEVDISKAKEVIPGRIQCPVL
jgi:hypothetical protein